MPIDPDSLPSDVAILRAMLSAQAVEMAEQATMVAAQRTELAAARVGLVEQRYEIEALRAPVGSGSTRCVRALIGEAARSVGATRADAGRSR